MRVPWAALDGGTYEQMVAVAISRLHPAAVRIDGSGGDGGRDVLLRAGDALTIFELKSFTGRLGGGRRAQVKRSLTSAAEHRPRAWFLVVPIDPSPQELDWFNNLQRDFPFTLTWYGLTWLEGQMAAMPEIPRYFLADTNAEVVGLLRQLREEQAAVDDVRDAAQRAERLHHRLNEIDPHYSYSIAVGPSADTPRPPQAVLSVKVGGSRIDVVERYRGATDDRPITGSAQLRLDHSSVELRAQMDEAFGFGAAVTIPPEVFTGIVMDAPGGLGSYAKSGELTLHANEARMDPPLLLTVEIVEDETVVSSLAFRFQHRRVGLHGAVLRGRDQTGCISATLRVDARQHRLSLSFSFDLPAESALPAMVRAAGIWLRALHPPRVLVARVAGAEQPLVAEKVARRYVDEEFFSRVFAIVDALDDIQRRTGVFFPLPLDLSRDKADEILRAQRLLKGERVTFPWSSIRMTALPSADSALMELATRDGVTLRASGEEWLELSGHRIPLGVVVTQVVARAADAAALGAAQGPGQEVEIILDPAGDSDAICWLQSAA